MTSVSYSFFLLLIDILFDLHIFLSPPNIAEARLIRRLISFVHFSSSVIRSPRSIDELRYLLQRLSIHFHLHLLGFLGIVIVFGLSPLIFSRIFCGYSVPWTSARIM